MPDTKSRLILTEEDYDNVYLGNTLFKEQLRSLLSQHRVVFFGYGYQDPEINRVLKYVGTICNPARPAYSFISDMRGVDKEAERNELLTKFNIDVIPYKTIKNSHKNLRDLLNAYGSMILTRSLRFGEAERQCPSYDPQTTGLLIYNELCLKNQKVINKNILGSLIKARILSQLKFMNKILFSDLVQDLNERCNLIQGKAPSGQEVESEIQKTVSELLSSGLINIDESDRRLVKLSLTTKGHELVSQQSSTAERLSDQFSSSLRSRAKELFSNDDIAVSRITKAAESFLKDCIDNRALGVALSRSQTDSKNYHLVALLQSLPDFMKQLKTAEEAICLTKIIQGILSNPSEAEKNYIGITIQARFGLHIMGYDTATLEARANDLINTLFLVDSNTLIPFLARSSAGYKSARFLIDRLTVIGSKVASTAMLIEEVAEHASWAAKKTEAVTGHLNPDAFRSITGHSGYKSNAFMEGFIEEVIRGQTTLDFTQYLTSVFGSTGNSPCKSKDIQTTLNGDRVYCIPFDKWEGFIEDHLAEREEIHDQIASLRKERQSFTHDRQVKAEAEALVIIRMLRNKIFKINGETVSNAYFISQTRVIDEVNAGNVPITLNPEKALHWLATISPCSIGELGLITNSLLCELDGENLSIIDEPHIIAAFSPYINASKEKLGEATEHHKILIAQRYGENAVNAFNETSDIYVSIVYENLNAQLVDKLSEKLKREQELRVKAQKESELAGKDRKKLDKLEAQERLRKLRARGKQRAVASRKGRKGKGKGKGKKKK